MVHVLIVESKGMYGLIADSLLNVTDAISSGIFQRNAEEGVVEEVEDLRITVGIIEEEDIREEDITKEEVTVVEEVSVTAEVILILVIEVIEVVFVEEAEVATEVEVEADIEEKETDTRIMP